MTYRVNMTQHILPSMVQRTVRTRCVHSYRTLGVTHHSAVSTHGVVGSRCSWLGRSDSMEEGSQRSFQLAQLQPSILPTIRFSSIKWYHNDTPRRTVWMDWHAPRLSSAHTFIASIVLSNHFRPLSLVRRRPYGRFPNNNVCHRFCFDTMTKISINHIQRIASLASRTSMLSRHMRPYTHELHIITSAYSNPHIRISLTLVAQSDILMWRSFVLLLVARPALLSRTLNSFRPQHPQYCFKYDASLYRIAVGVYTADTDLLLTFAAVDLPFVVNNEARRQNTMEFIAIIFGLLLCWRQGLTTFHYNLHGDSKSSLAWAQANRVNSMLARRRNIVFTTLSMHLDANVAEATHIPGTLNVVFDGLSRNVHPSELGLDVSKEFNAANDASMLSFLRLCDPDDPLDDITAHTNLLHTCTSLLTP